MNKQESIDAIEMLRTDMENFHKLLAKQPNSPVKQTIKKQIKAYETAISALEKQIPQMGIPCNSYKNHNFVECGVCNRDMGMYYQYCPHCGQKAKWRNKYE